LHASSSTSDRATLMPMLLKFERRGRLGDADRKALLALPHNVRRMSAGTHIIRDGDKPDYCSVVLSGFAFRHKITGEGGRQVIAIHMEGDFVDLQNCLLPVSDHNVQMLTDGEVAFIAKDAVRDLALSRSAIGMAMWVDTMIDSAIFREWVVNVGRRDARARIAHMLCEFSLRLEAAGLAKEHRYELPMTQEQLADSVGLTSVHVNRVLRQLGEEGLISRNKRAIVIESWSRMRDAGDFNERYLHHDAAAAAASLA
jgi:CRP-like cAMP-binding protein